MDWITATLKDLREQDLLRTLRSVESPAGPTAVVGGRELLNLASNSYLDLANHPAVVAAAREAVARWGWGAGASQLICGYTRAHQDLCGRLCRFEEAEDCVLFPTGYQANVGTIQALVGRGDRVIIDRLCHASIIDGARLSGARLKTYPHLDLDRLADLLSQPGKGRTLVITDTVFSMDGDLAPLGEIVPLCHDHGAILMVDEAHATGVFGPRGGGVAQEAGVADRIPVRIGTLSKALGSIGGFVVGSRELCDLLRNRARAAIFTTAMPPAAAEAASAALDVIEREPERRERLLSLCQSVRTSLQQAGVSVAQGSGPIIPIITGSAESALRLARALLQSDILAPAIRPPTVPRSQSRIRLSLMSSHTKLQMDRLTQLLPRILSP